MSITLDDLELVARDEGDPGTINEFRTVNRIFLKGKRRLVETRTAGGEGSVFEDKPGLSQDKVRLQRARLLLLRHRDLGEHQPGGRGAAEHPPARG